MSTTKIIIILISLSLFFLVGGVVVLSKTSPFGNISQSPNTKVQVSENEADWGNINFNGPKATKTFKIKNIGFEPLKLANVKTSCTCTSAQIIIDSKKSPLFSMHSSSSWVGEVAAGKEADLVVVFDQAFHGPSGVGPIERLISLETNDASNPKIEFKLRGYVIK